MKRGVRQGWKRQLCVLACILGAVGLILGVTSCEWLFNRFPLAGFTIGPSTGGTAPFTVHLTGTATDPDQGDELTYGWVYGDGTPNGAGNTVSHVYTTAGTFVIVLTVTDNHGATDITQRTVYVTAAQPTGPTARMSASPTSGTSPLTVSFDASASTYALAAISSYEWNFGDNGTSVGRNVAHTYVSTGSRTYTVTLTVRGADGTTGVATTQIIVSAPGGGDTPVPGSPSARFVMSRTTGVAPLKVDFDPDTSEADDGRTLVAFAWSFGDGSAASSATATEQTHTYVTTKASETFSITLVVIDNEGATNTVTKTLKVENRQPVAGFQINDTLSADGAVVPPAGGTWETDDVTFDGVVQTESKVWIRSLNVADPNWTRNTAAPTPATGTPAAAGAVPAYVNHNYSYDREGQYWTAGAPAWFPNNGWGIEHYDIDWGDGTIEYNVTFASGAMNAGKGHDYAFAGSLVKTIKVTAYDYLGGKSSYERTVTLNQ